MLRQIQTILAPVRTRQRLARAQQWGVLGLLFGAIAGSLMMLARWFGAPLGPTEAFSVLATSTVLGGVLGFVWPASWQSSARLVDRAFGLKDRTVTAMEFALQDKHDPIHALQVNDTLDHLSGIDAAKAVPWKSPRLTPFAAAAVVAMLVLLFLNVPPTVSQASLPAGPLPVVLDQASLLEETLLEELEELAEENQDPELEKLVEEMKEAIEELKEPDTDQRDALAQLSEMQAALAAAAQQLDVQRVDAELQQLAEALQDAGATQAASQSLEALDYEQAAKELEKIDASTMDRKQRDAVAANLQKLSNKLGEGKKGKLSQSVQKMAEGMESGNESKCKSGFCDAAGECRKQGVRKSISECLACQLNRLAECKCNCQGNGQCNGSGNVVKKSDSPTNKAGRGSSNQPLGDEKTKLASTRRQEDLTGMAGDGPSERETLSANEAEQQAARAYQERYSEYRKQMEEVLDSEPLPLGHRETVRAYFESIRPTNDQTQTQ